MTLKKFSVQWIAASSALAAAFAIVIATNSKAFGQDPVNVPVFQTLLSFDKKLGGNNPEAPLIFDANRVNLYGTTVSGGLNDEGTVFELIPGIDGTWTEINLYSFGVWQGGDCAQPYGPLILDQQGNLYGTTIYGGTDDQGCVFQLSPDGNGGWTEHILHSFTGYGDGSAPSGTLAIDSAGNLYGAASTGGEHIPSCSYGCGTLFRLAPRNNGEWGFSTILLFDYWNGYSPGGLSFDKRGNLWGATYYGGDYGYGVVFELTSQNGGQSWNYYAVHSFNGTDGASPAGATLAFGSSGEVYGETANDPGSVFELTPDSSGNYNLSTIHTFLGMPDGIFPRGGVILDKSGNLYGTTYYGGNSNSVGTVFEITPSATGWEEKILYPFRGAGDGAFPATALVTDGQGHFYGTTTQGAYYHAGSVFEITP